MKIIKEGCTWRRRKNRGETAIDHVRLLLSKVPIFNIGSWKAKAVSRYIKNLGQAKFRYRCREFWCRGNDIDKTGKNTQGIKEHIRNRWKTEKEKYAVFDSKRALFRAASGKRKDRRAVSLAGVACGSRQGYDRKWRTAGLAPAGFVYIKIIVAESRRVEKDADGKIEDLWCEFKCIWQIT